MSRLVQTLAEAQYQRPPRKNADSAYSGYRFDAVILSRFLDSGLGDTIISGYKMDGFSFYQAFMRQ
jgi:hypothetical protein